MTKEKWTIIATVVALVAVLWIWGRSGRRNLRNRMLCSSGSINKITVRLKDPGILFYYSFYIGGEKLDNQILISCDNFKLSLLQHSLLNRKCIVIYDSADYHNNTMILTQDLARLYGINANLSDSDRILINYIDSVCSN
jgi:hypothetical protein